MKNEIFIFKVSEIVSSETGASENYSIKGPIKLEGIKTSSDIEGKVEIMKIEEGVNVVVSEVKVFVDFKCEKCLAPFTKQIFVPQAEAIFYLNKPAFSKDPLDTFFINKKDFKIDLTELVRQELILHFPSIAVCSLTCKGLCPVCGKDSNKEECSCDDISHDIDKIKPLSKLKDLMK